MTEAELQEQLAARKQELRAALACGDTDAVRRSRDELGRLTAEIHRLRVNGKRQGVQP